MVRIRNKGVHRLVRNEAWNKFDARTIRLTGAYGYTFIPRGSFLALQKLGCHLHFEKPAGTVFCSLAASVCRWVWEA